jgi:hypothetical protein
MVDRKGTLILNMKLQKALNRLMRASVLFYRKLRKELKAYGFTINPYDVCMANLITWSRKQLPVVWHVDDDYLGVGIEFIDNGMLKVSIVRYLRNVITEFPEMING